MIRKHRIALIAAAAYNFVFFFPTLFMGRVVSPNDVFFNYQPWSFVPHLPVQNSLLNDTPTSYFTLMSLLKSGGAFHWNPFVACGIPGVGSSAAAVLTPFVLVPVFLLPLTWVYTAIIVLKLNVAFWLSYMWLREERLGKRGAAIGAIVFAGAGVYAVRWLWQATNATALYPGLLWAVRRAFNGRRLSMALLIMLGVAYAVAGFPAVMAYGAAVAVVYAVFLAIRERRLPGGAVARTAMAIVISFLIAAPAVIPFVQFVRRSGYLEMRADMSLHTFFPLSSFLSFVEPQRLGNPALKNWRGSPDLAPILDNFVESTVYLGIAALPLILLAAANRRARSRWFWFGVLLVAVSAMFGLPAVVAALGRLPGFKYSLLARLSMVLPLPAAYLAAAGSAWLIALLRRHGGALLAWCVAAAIAIAAAGDLAIFAGTFYPYLPPQQTIVPETPTIAFLRAQPKPFRVAAFFDYLWPNSSELFGIEDVRSHFSSEAKYRQLLQRIDPTAWSGRSTVLQFDSRKFDYADPLTGMLGIRYFLEHKTIDIVRWTTFAATVPGVKGNGAFILQPGRTVQRTVRVDAEPFYAIELPVAVEATTGEAPSLDVQLIRFGSVLWERAFTPQDIAVMGKVYIPLRPYARLGDSVTLRVRSYGIRANMLKSVPVAGEDPLFYGRVKTPVVFDRELPDGRIYLNTAEVPRFRAALRVSKMSDREFLSRRDIDLGDEAVITGGAAALPPVNANALVYLKKYGGEEQRLETSSASPFFLASSEKLTPELGVTIDGRSVVPVEINTIFAGVTVPAGTHSVIFSRRIARGWWWPAGAGLLLFVAIATGEIAGAISRRIRFS